ncbi:sensor domain-containing diguanylate cyclase [Reinekea marinisedimentorum]|nr:sensor domain-containing diguanylate cyclase [Reinekea marinisedimentorum]
METTAPASSLESVRNLNLLDTEAEERFDRLTRMARRMFDVPVAFISLVDENRHWFKSRFGLELSEVSSSIPVLAEIVKFKKPIVITNAEKDARLKETDLVTGAENVRFYVGVPLRSVSGDVVGTLSIVDRTTRVFRDEDLAMLEDIARIVEKEIAEAQESTMDELTGISSRKGFYLIAEHSLSVTMRYQTEATLVIMQVAPVDVAGVSNFAAKQEAMLKAFGQLLKQFFRNSDLVGRLVADKFVVLLHETGVDAAYSVIGKLQSEVEHFCAKHSPEFPVVFSAGVAAFTAEHPRTIHQLIETAEDDLFQ